MKNIVITGVGTISALGIGFENYKEQYINNSQPLLKTFDIEDCCKGMSVRRNDDFTKYALCAFKDLMDRNNYTEIDAEERSIIANTYLGPVNTVSDFLKTAIDDGLEGASPSYFSNTVINAALGKISIDYELKGNSYMFCGTNPLCYAIHDLRNDRSKVYFVGGMDDARCQIPCSFNESQLFYEGATYIGLETEQNAKARGAEIIANLDGIGVSYRINVSGEENVILEKDISDAMKQALAESGINMNKVSKVYMFSSEIGTESNAIDKLFESDRVEKIFARMDYAKFLSAGEFFGLLDALSEITEKDSVLVNIKALDCIISMVVSMNGK